MTHRIGFLVNPIAGMGGRVGLKGTDGEAYKIALKLGAKPVAPQRAKRFLLELKRLKLQENIEFITPPHVMGEKYLRETSITNYKVVDMKLGEETTAKDTKEFVKKVLEEVELIVFVGGDGTARDIVEVVGENKPLLGVPSGVKVYSSVFATTPEKAAHVLRYYLEGLAEITKAEILDIDEEAFRKDKLIVKKYGTALTIYVQGLVQPSKEPSMEDPSEEENKKAIARYIVENMDKNTLYILGPGTTVKAIADELGVEKTTLGVDAVYNGELVGKDLNEQKIMDLIKKYRKVKIIVTPIGGQGFIFGRGNQQISPTIIRLVGKENIIVVATRSKMRKLGFLRVDTGDPEVDEILKGYMRVIVDYNEEVVVKVV